MKYGFTVDIDVESATEFQLDMIYGYLQATIKVLSTRYKGTNVTADFSDKLICKKGDRFPISKVKIL